MGGVLDYSTTAASNTTVGGVSIAEGMAPGNVNNGMRAQMADTRKWQLDWSGITTAGTGNAYTITSNQGISAYADGMRFSFRADRANTGAATLNVDGRGAKAIRRMDGSAAVALVSGDLIANGVYDVVYVLADDVFVVVNSFGTLPGLTATIAELNYMDGVTSAVQTQLNAKQAADATLTSLSGLTLAAGDILYATAADTLVNLAKGTAGQVLRMNTGATAPEWGSSGPAWRAEVATTSGDDLDLSTAIPNWASELIVSLRSVSLNGSDNILVQLGTAGGYVTSGYTSSCGIAGGVTGGSSSTAGALVYLGSAGRAFSGFVRLHKISGNIWSFDVCGGDGASNIIGGGGHVDLGAAITQIRLSSSGTNTFDAGAASVGWK